MILCHWYFGFKERPGKLYIRLIGLKVGAWEGFEKSYVGGLFLLLLILTKGFRIFLFIGTLHFKLLGQRNYNGYGIRYFIISESGIYVWAGK